MNIQERRNKNGKITSYRIRVFDHRDITTGKQVFRNLSVKYDDTKSENWNRKNAEKEGAVFEKSVEEHTATDSNITFDVYAQYVTEIKVNAGISTSTEYGYTFRRQRLAPYIGHIKLKDLTPNTLNKAYAELLKAGFNSNYVRSLHGLVHTILGMAFKEGLIPRNYAAAATPPKYVKAKGKAIPEAVMHRFFKLLFEDDSEFEYQVFFNLLLATGCRVGELCALQWTSVDFNEGRIHINQRYVMDKKGRHVEKGCKTTAGERWIYLDNSTMDMLSEYKKFYNRMARDYGSKWDFGTKAVFTQRKTPGFYLNPNSVRSWLEKFCIKHNLPHLTPHMFRHTAISIQIQSGISITDVSARAGHSRPDITLSAYTHVIKNNDRHCCEVITKVLRKIPKSKTG